MVIPAMLNSLIMSLRFLLSYQFYLKKVSFFSSIVEQKEYRRYSDKKNTLFESMIKLEKIEVTLTLVKKMSPPILKFLKNSINKID